MFLRFMTEHEDAPIPLLSRDTMLYLGFLIAVAGAARCVSPRWCRSLRRRKMPSDRPCIPPGVQSRGKQLLLPGRNDGRIERQLHEPRRTGADRWSPAARAALTRGPSAIEAVPRALRKGSLDAARACRSEQPASCLCPRRLLSGLRRRWRDSNICSSIDRCAPLHITLPPPYGWSTTSLTG